jgi:anti-sigma-K factor RskA
MAETNHDAMHELTGLYVLGALDQAERRAFETHMASCAACAAEVRTLGGVVRALPYGVPQVDPPAGLRDRVLGAAQTRAFQPGPLPDRARTFNPGWLAAAALLVIAVGLGAYAVTLRERIGGLELRLADAVTRLSRSEQQVAVAVRSAETAEARMAVLTAPDVLQVDLAGQKPAPQARGRAFLSRARGLLFAANALPPLPAGRTYQLWYLRTAPAPPVSAGLLQPDAGGQIVTAFQPPADTVTPSGFAVSIEPEGGVPQPTGDLYLVGTAQAAR